MFYRVIAQEPHNIALADVKRQCSIMPDFALDDELLTHLTDAAFHAAQSYTQKMLTKADVVVVFEQYKNSFLLPFGEINGGGIQAVHYKDGIEITTYNFNLTTNKLSLPASASGGYDYTIKYRVGYECIPKQVLQGIYLLVNTMYLNRENFVVGETVSNIPVNSLLLWDTVKNYAI